MTTRAAGETGGRRDRQERAVRGARGRSNPAVPRAPLLLTIFVVSLAVPVIFYAGPLRLSAYRLLLLAAFLPLFFGWLTGRTGKIIAADICMLLHCVWASLSLMVNHPPGEVLEAAGIRFIEVFGAYLLARTYIRSQSDFEGFVKVLVSLMLFLAPIALVELLFNKLLINDVVRLFASSFYDANRPTRWGLQRVQGPFEHPILFGVFCSAAFSLGWYVSTEGKSRLHRFSRAAPSAFNTFASLSTGAFLSVVTQVALLAWDRFSKGVRRRWRLLGILTASAYIFVDLLSNRTPVQVFISYLTFNASNAYNRLHIWRFGTEEVIRHPIFGIGQHDWERGWWMTASMDNFWLVVAMRHGMPSFLLLVAAMLLIIRGVARADSNQPGMLGCQKGYLFSIIGLAVAVCTVHLWNATFTFFMFLIGSGAWMTSGSGSGGASSESSPGGEKMRARTTLRQSNKPERCRRRSPHTHRRGRSG